MERKEQNTEFVSISKQGKGKSQTKEKSVIILGDSVVKHLNGYDISRKVTSEWKVYVGNFAGAKKRCMKDYLMPSLRENPDHFILHMRTKDLNSQRSPEPIAKSIVHLATSLKNENQDVSIPNIIARTDNQELRQKAITINKALSEIYREINLYLIDNLKKISNSIYI